MRMRDGVGSLVGAEGEDEEENNEDDGVDPPLFFSFSRVYIGPH